MAGDRITAGELKNWAYCQRVVFYRRHMSHASRETFKMREALAAQDLVERLELRRSLQAYGLEGYARKFGMWLEAPVAGLCGKPDLVLVGDRDAAVVDFKLTAGEPGGNHSFQLAAYALMVEEVLRVEVRNTFLYRIPDDCIFAVPVTDEQREEVLRAVRDIREMDESEILPEATEVRARCGECEYAMFCGDVW